MSLTLLRALQRTAPGLDALTVQEAGLTGAPDDDVLAWAAREGRIVLSHDLRTMPAAAEARVAAGQPMPGVWLVRARAPRAAVIEDVFLLVTASEPSEWRDRVLYLPLTPP